MKNLNELNQINSNIENVKEKVRQDKVEMEEFQKITYRYKENI